MGTPLTVVGGCSRGGAAAFSLSQRSRAAVSVTSGHEGSVQKESLRKQVKATFCHCEKPPTLGEGIP